MNTTEQCDYRRRTIPFLNQRFDKASTRGELQDVAMGLQRNRKRDNKKKKKIDRWRKRVWRTNELNFSNITIQWTTNAAFGEKKKKSIDPGSPYTVLPSCLPILFPLRVYRWLADRVCEPRPQGTSFVH